MLSPRALAALPHDEPLRLAMQSSGIGMAIVDARGCWLQVNPALERMLGHTADELVGRPTSAFTHPDDIRHSQASLDRLLDGSLLELDTRNRYLRKDGGVLCAQVNVAAMRDAQGRTTGLIVQVRDVGEQQAAEQALRKLNETLEQRVEERSAQLLASYRQQEQFAYGISHDLRAPLRAIDSFAALLGRQAGERLDDVERGYLDRIRAATARMGGLIDSLSQLSRVSRAELRPQPVDLGLLAEWAQAELAEAEPERDARLDVQPGLVAQGDERLLKVLMQQLLHNAWRFSPRAVDIAIGGGVAGGRLRVSVRDQGLGFDAQYADKLFEPFQRLHGADQGAGAGIGLAIAECIVQRHGGRIWAESSPGQGSTFHLELPAADVGAAGPRPCPEAA